MTFICPILGQTAESAWHATVHLGLTAFVVTSGAMFLTSAVIAYRRPVDRPPGPR